MIGKCGRCGGSIIMANETFERKTSFGTRIQVLNVPVKSCGCKSKYTDSFDIHNGVIIEDFVRNLDYAREKVDFQEIKDAYEGLSTRDIYEKRKAEQE